MSHVTDLPLARICAYCWSQPIRRLSLFGSVLRDDFAAASDVDMLVDLELGVPVTLLDMARMERELGDIVGRKVDLRTAQDLHQRFRQHVVESAETIYGDRRRAAG